MKLPEINETLNELFQTILDGLDYVSAIAVKTGKSIPVVHRQLDRLLEIGLLERKRKGKRVIYEPRWERIVERVSAQLSPDDAETIQPIVSGFFADPAVQKLFREFFASLHTKDRAEYERLSFDASAGLFLDVFGMLSEEQEQVLLAKAKDPSTVERFLPLCRAWYKRRQLLDPRQAILKKLEITTKK